MKQKKKILIVSKSFFPENSPRSHRATELAKEFVRQGHHVTVITPKVADIHVEFEKEHQITIIDLGKPVWKRFNFGQTRFGDLLTRVFVRGLQLLAEYPDIELMFMVKKALRMEQGYDLLISIAVPYPVHWGVAAVWDKKRILAKTWVADCGDPYMGCTTDTFNKLFHFKYVEKWFMRKADFVTIPVESARNAYYEEFHKKIRIIPQGFKIEPMELPVKSIKYKVPTFAYAGGFIPTIRDPRPFLDYLSSLNTEYLFVIFTNQAAMIDSFREKLGDKLEIRPYISRNELLCFLYEMDFLINFDNNTGTAVPSKLIDYTIAGRPVLNIKKDLDASVITQFLAGDYTGAMNIGKIENYRIENVCSAFLALAVDTV